MALTLSQDDLDAIRLIVQEELVPVTNAIDALPGAAAANVFNDQTYDTDGVAITQGTISSGTPANTLTIGTPLIIASSGAGIDVNFEFELGTARVNELVVAGYYTGAGGAATSKYASVYLWDYSLAVPAWALITDGSNRIPHGATNVLREYVLSPQYQDPATGTVKVRYVSSRVTSGDTLVIDQHYVQGVSTGYTLEEIANAIWQYVISSGVAQDGTHSRAAWFLWALRAVTADIDSIAGSVLTLSGARFDSTSNYVGHTIQFHLGNTNSYRWARITAQTGADVTVDTLPADVTDAWHCYILPDRLLTQDLVQDGLATSGEITALQAHGDTEWATADVSALATQASVDGLPSAGDVADAVWDEALSGHTDTGSAGAALSSAGVLGDPWSVDLPGAYDSPEAGYIIGRLAAIDTSAVSVTSNSIAGHLTLVCARTFEASVTGLTIPAAWETAIWTLKWNRDQVDTASIVQLRVSNPADVVNDGLLRLNGATLVAPITAADGSLTVDQAGGAVAIWLSDELTAQLRQAVGLGWDVKFIDEEGDSSGTRGTADVSLTETRALA